MQFNPNLELEQSNEDEFLLIIPADNIHAMLRSFQISEQRNWIEMAEELKNKQNFTKSSTNKTKDPVWDLINNLEQDRHIERFD